MNDFGGTLRQARERRGISLRQMAASTKISVAVLEALERNDISRLPGGIFSRGFVRSYATEVGLDPDKTVHEFLDRFQAEPDTAVDSPGSDRERPARIAVDRSAALRFASAGIVAVAAILYFTLRSHAPAPETAVPAPAAVPVPTGRDIAERPASAAGTPARPAAVAAAVETIRIDIHPTAPCWISLTVDGEHILPRVMQAGEHEVRTVTRQAVVEIGDAGAFAWTIDGRPGRVLGQAGQVRTVRITPSTASGFLR